MARIVEGKRYEDIKDSLKRRGRKPQSFPNERPTGVLSGRKLTADELLADPLRRPTEIRYPRDTTTVFDSNATQPLTLEQRIDQLITEEPERFPPESVARVRQFVQYETENPEMHKPYRLLKDIVDFGLYYRLHPDWKGGSSGDMNKDVPPGTKSFYKGFLYFTEKQANGDKRIKKRLIRQVLPTQRGEFSQFITIDEWKKEFERHPEWFGKSPKQMRADRKSGAGRYYDSLMIWINQKERDKERRKEIRDEILKTSIQAQGETIVPRIKIQVLGNMEQSDDSKTFINAVDQTRGFEYIREYFRGKIKFHDIPPILIQNARQYDKLTPRISIGRVASEKELLIVTNGKMAQVLQKRGRLLAVPMQDENKYYQWLDFYEIDDKNAIDRQQLLGSYRVDANTYSIKTLEWYGYETQLFLDYLAGKKAINPSHLKEFKGRAIGETIKIGSISGKDLRIHTTHALPPETEVTFMPHYDHLRGYTWLEAHIADENGKNTCIVSRRFYRGRKKLYEWGGYEVQPFIDWIHGSLPFELTKSAKFYLDNETLSISLGNNIRLSFKGHSRISRSNYLNLVPKNDDLYEWFDVYNLNDGDETKNSSPISSYRVLRNGTVRLDSLRWHGPNKQRWVDLFDGLLNFDNLLPLSLNASSAKIGLFDYKNRSFCFSSKSFDISPEDHITAIPISYKDNVLMFEVTREGTRLAQFCFDSKALSVYSLKEGSDQPKRKRHRDKRQIYESLSSDEAREELMKLVEEEA